MTRPARWLGDLAQWMSPTFRRIRREHAKWDAEHHVDTAPGNQAGWMADIESENWSHGRGYHPAPSDSLIRRLSDLDIDYRDYTFIDFGSGKGRSLFAASNFPFSKIIGVEFNRYLHDTAVKNTRTYRSDQQQCADIDPVHADAIAYEIPDQPMVYYFYDPFAEPVMRPVVDNIFRRLRENGKKCFVIYFNPVFAEYFENSDQFRRIAQGSEFENYWNRTRLGNKDANEFTSELLDAERYVVYESVSQANLQ
ncbi:class I SAM-dependent methyltransferase [Neorhodopirellula pilleata]|uniref:class I SAM-dependent methyltransferase n=1 Tax=Neorhodopirellula pilleata TaxID=2714738 RepID=UPI0011B66F40|nr:class I SAM-dependent methyltransferase [Neorhodopirellula pilleata]